MKKPKPLLLMLVLFVCLFNTVVHAQTRYQDSLALVDLYNSTDGANWTNNSNWLTGPLEDWYGISFNWMTNSDRVNSIRLENNNLTGSIPVEIENLTELGSLRLPRNKISGSIPMQIGNLFKLIYLDLEINELTGSIPVNIGNLQQLVILKLNINKLDGAIPHGIGYLTNLETLYLYSNKFTYLTDSIYKLHKLYSLNLCDNKIKNIPKTLGMMTNLGSLFLYRNDISGTIPKELSTMSRLSSLLLYENNLKGPIPEELFELPNLRRFDIGDNNFSGPIPNGIAKWEKLQSLGIRRNSFTGTIPDTFRYLTNLSGLDVSYNNLSGSFPECICTFTQLTYFKISNNQFEGEIPSCIGHLLDIKYFEINNNRLYGAIPDSAMYWSNLNYLRLNHNLISELPDLSGISTLKEVELQANKFTFEDIEPLIGVVPTVDYRGQDSVLTSYDTIVLKDSSVALFATIGGDSNLYQWYKNDTLLEGATDSILKLENVTITNEGIYSCDVTNSIVMNLTIPRRPVTVRVDTNAIISIADKGDVIVEVYPNPAEDYLVVRINSHYYQQLFSLFDLNGRVVKKVELKHTETRISLEDLSKGIYMARIITNGKVQQFSVIIN